MINPPNLPGGTISDSRHLLEREFHLPARIENDANAAGLAEVLFGAAVGYRDVFYVTVSTGIGTGVIINKKIYHGKNGVGGEGGHVSIDFRSPYRCGCGTLGCIEALAAGPAMARRARVALEQEHSRPSLLRELSGGDLRKIDPVMIQEAARRGDGLAKSIIDETGFFLGAWLGGMMSLFDPEAIIIGGGVAQIGKPLFDKIRQTMPQLHHQSTLRRGPPHPACEAAKERRRFRRGKRVSSRRRGGRWSSAVLSELKVHRSFFGLQRFFAALRMTVNELRIRDSTLSLLVLFEAREGTIDGQRQTLFGVFDVTGKRVVVKGYAAFADGGLRLLGTDHVVDFVQQNAEQLQPQAGGMKLFAAGFLPRIAYRARYPIKAAPANLPRAQKRYPIHPPGRLQARREAPRKAALSQSHVDAPGSRRCWCGGIG